LTKADIAAAIVMSLGLPVLFIGSMGWVGRGWTWIFERLAALLGFAGGVGVQTIRFGSLIQFQLPHFNVVAPQPGNALWWITLVVSVVAVLVSLLFRDAFLPFAYALRLAAMVQGTALLFFRAAPWPFPYELTGYVTGMLLAGATVIALVPILLGLTYYIMDVRLLQKLGLTAAIMGHLLLFVPLQYAVQSYVIAHGSLLFLPISFILFGVLPEIMIFVAFYGWGMSWSGCVPRGRRE
jgi:hypothetical protein